MIGAVVIWLLTFVANCGDQVINMFQVVGGSAQPITVVRETPIMVKYNLLILTWSIFPDLHDKFNL